MLLGTLSVSATSSISQPIGRRLSWRTISRRRVFTFQHQCCLCKGFRRCRLSRPPNCWTLSPMTAIWQSKESAMPGLVLYRLQVEQVRCQLRLEPPPPFVLGRLSLFWSQRTSWIWTHLRKSCLRSRTSWPWVVRWTSPSLPKCHLRSLRPFLWKLTIQSPLKRSFFLCWKGHTQQVLRERSLLLRRPSLAWQCWE